MKQLNTYSMSDFAYKIFLDRYALKDNTKKLHTGDVVIALLSSDGNDMTQRREIGIVKNVGIENITLTIYPSGDEVTISEHLLDKPLELSPSDMWRRVSWGTAQAEPNYHKQTEWENKFNWLLDDWKFVPGGRILNGAGTEQDVSLFNCFVIKSPHDSRGGIIKTLATMMELMSHGGGVGFNISTLRPQNSYVKGVNARSSGAVSFCDMYSLGTGLIQQGGSRRGALLIMLNDWHPDVVSFIHVKQNMSKITNANISVGISDKFMDAVKNNEIWQLRFPDTTHNMYNEEWDGIIENWESKGYPVINYGKNPLGGYVSVPDGTPYLAKEIWDMLIAGAHSSAEPGIWFRERVNNMSNSNYYTDGYLVGTNPCVTGDTLVSTNKGYIRADTIQVGDCIMTPTGFKPVEKVYNNGEQRIWNIKFSDGGDLRATSDHKLKVIRNKQYEWVEINKLIIGDEVLITPNTNGFRDEVETPTEYRDYLNKYENDNDNVKLSGRYDKTLGLLVGVTLCDGVFRTNKSQGSYSHSLKLVSVKDEHEWENLIYQIFDNANIKYHRNLIEKEIEHRNGAKQIDTFTSIATIPHELATMMAKIGLPLNIKSPNKKLPDHLFNSNREFLAGVIDGLFSTDGDVSPKTENPMIRFSTASIGLAKQVRYILLQFGIHAGIYKSERKGIHIYDDRNINGTGEKFDVLIMDEGVTVFAKEIGISHHKKSKRMKEIADNHHFIGTSLKAKVVSIEDTGVDEEVYDLYEPEHLTWITNGYTSFDCGEQSLPNFGICNLGALNIAKFYDDIARDVNWADIECAVEYGVRFLDNIIDTSKYHMIETEAKAKDERRIGLGVTGLGELLIKLELRYGSEDAIKFTDKLFKFIANEAYLASACLAKEKGVFKYYEPKLLNSSGYMRQMKDELKETWDYVKENGLRNVTLLTCAPNGTTGTMTETSTGIEPFFALNWYRTGRLGTHKENLKIAQDWLDNHEGESLPSYFVTAMDLTPYEHVAMQGAIQKWVDSSISKTTNVPNDFTIQETSDLYMYMHELGCKGGTIYRDGSRNEQVLTPINDSKNIKPIKPENAVDDILNKYDKSEDTTLIKIPLQPANMTARLLRGDTPYGTVFITISEDPHGTPYAIFVTIGKSGSDLQAQGESMGRMFSLSLQSQPENRRRQMLEILVEQNTGIGGARPGGFGKNRVTSFPDAVAKIIREEYIEKMEKPIENNSYLTIESEALIPVAKFNGTVGIVANSYINIKGANTCPNCHNNTLISEDGCINCISCGYSEC